MFNRICIIACVLMCFVSFGCASRTKATLGPLTVGGHTEAHQYRDPSFSMNKNGVEATLGWVTAGVNGEVTEGNRFFAFETITGETSAVESTDIAVWE